MEKKHHILLLGNGGREHAMAWKLSQSPKLGSLFVAPGSDGIAHVKNTTCVDIAATDIDGLLSFAKSENIDVLVVGPEQPLALGVADAFLKHDIPVFGPSKSGALLESSKIFAKEIMHAANIPTAESHVFENLDELISHIEHATMPLVLKADGLAAGKGVRVCSTKEDALDFARQLMGQDAFGQAGRRVLVEECLKGRECSIMAVTDGRSIQVMESAQDHKRLSDGDHGPNTGGMGAYSPSPIFDQTLKQNVLERVFQPLLKELQKRNISFCGVIYAGLMVTEKGPYVLEFNVRFGDPETQVILPRLKSDFLEMVLATVHGSLDTHQPQWSSDAAITIVMASKGYPQSSEKGISIEGLDALKHQNHILFHAGTKKTDSGWVTNGGRVLSLTTMAVDVASARKEGYQELSKIHFKGSQFRKDIGLDG